MVSKSQLGDIINNADATGRVAKWGIELAAFDIKYQPRTAIKSQVLKDFIAYWTEAMENTLMSTHTSIVDSVGPPSAEVCRTATSFP